MELHEKIITAVGIIAAVFEIIYYWSEWKKNK